MPGWIWPSLAAAYLLTMVACLFVILNSDLYEHAPAWKALEESEGKFKSRYLRKMAEKVLEYRLLTELKGTDANIKFYTKWGTMTPEQKLKLIAGMDDCVLHQCVKEPAASFSNKIHTLVEKC